MDYTCRTKTLQALNKSMEKGGIILSHKLQRPEGQWNQKQKTDLIDSLLRKYPINPTYAIKENGVLAVIDGVQRLSCVRDFIASKFSLSKGMEVVVVNGEEKKLAGRKFNKLDDDTKDAILNSELQVYELTDCSEKDVREMFRRQNAGKPLNGKLMRVVYESDELSEAVYNLTKNPFMIKLTTAAQRKNGTDRNLIIQTLMLISTSNEKDFTSFRNRDMDNFVMDYADQSLGKVSTLTEAMNEFNEAFSEIGMSVTSIPMLLYSGYRVKLNKQSFPKLVEVVKGFIESYESNEEYKKFVASDTTGQENVRGRLAYWQEMIKNV